MNRVATCFHVMPDAGQVADAAVRWLCAEADAALAARGVFKCVLAGGSTPEKVYQQLAATPADWSRWQLYLGDERCLPVGHAERNDQLLSRSGLAATGVKFYPIPAELGAEAAAAAYQATVLAALPFDVVLLGLGEDGHTASLFPGHVWPEAQAVCAVTQAPKPPSERVSLTPWALSQAHQVLFLVTGAAKADAVAHWYRGGVLPAAQITPMASVTVLVDRAAWGQLEPVPAREAPVYCTGDTDV